MPQEREKQADSFATRLRSLRERSGLSQEELAERAGLTAHAVSALERGIRTRPYPHTVRCLADALNVSDAERTELIATVPSRRRSASTPSPAKASPRATPQAVDRDTAGADGWAVPPTRLYGRDADVAAIVDWVRDSESRLITLTGPGGVGKTRLASAVSEELGLDHPDGTLIVALASVTDASSVVAVIARALGLAGTDATDALSTVVAFLSPQRFLLVLDNFEHLLTAASDVADLVARCPHLTVLVSSRSPLRVRGEREYAVAPLGLPPAEVCTVDEIAAAPAGALLLDRARAVAPTLPTSSDQVRALGVLCHQLAGLPLAIELATPRLRVLSPTSLLERLSEVTANSAARDLPARQRTMRAALDWSYELLGPHEQALFRLLGAFRAGATLEAIEHLAAASDSSLSPAGVLDQLEQLVEHSLIVVRDGVDGRRRYDMLEPVAQYARARLFGTEAERASRAHAQHYLSLTERAAHGYARADQVAWLARTEADEANISVAIDRSLDLGNAETAGRITWAMWLYWWLRGQVAMGRSRAEQCLDADVSSPLLGRMHLTAAAMAYAAGDFDACSRYWAEAFRLGSEQQDPEVMCLGRTGTGLAALAIGDRTTADEHLREALTLGSAAGDAGVWVRSLVHVWLGTVRLLGGDPTGAVPEIERGLVLARQRGDRLAIYVALYNLSQAAIAAADYRAARRHLEEGIGLSVETQDMANLAYFLDALAVVESADDHSHRVAVLLGVAQSLRETVGVNVYAYYVPDESLRAAAEAAARTALGDDAFDDALDIGRGIDPREIGRLALAST